MENQEDQLVFVKCLQQGLDSDQPYLYHALILDILVNLLTYCDQIGKTYKNLLKDQLPANLLLSYLSETDFFETDENNQIKNKEDEQKQFYLAYLVNKQISRMFRVLYGDTEGQNEVQAKLIAWAEPFIRNKAQILENIKKGEKHNIYSNQGFDPILFEKQQNADFTEEEQKQYQIRNTIIQINLQINTGHYRKNEQYLTYFVRDLMPIINQIIKVYNKTTAGDNKDNPFEWIKINIQDFFIKNTTKLKNNNDLQKALPEITQSEKIQDLINEIQEIYAQKVIPELQTRSQLKNDAMLNEPLENLINLPLQNLLSEKNRKNRGKDDKGLSSDTYCKGKILDILISSQVKKLVEFERQRFVWRLILNDQTIDQLKYDWIDDASRQNLRMKYSQVEEHTFLEIFIKRLIQFLKVLFQEYTKLLDKQSMTLIMQTIRQLYYFLLYYEDIDEKVKNESEQFEKKFPNEDQKKNTKPENQEGALQQPLRKEKNFQEIFAKYGLINVLLEFLCNPDLDFQKHYRTHKILKAVILLLTQMLNEGNYFVQEQCYKFFINEPSQENFFRLIYSLIEKEINQLEIGKFVESQVYETIEEDLDNLNLVYRQEDKFVGIVKIVRMVQLFCENHNSHLQNYLRQQTSISNNYNILQQIVILLDKYVRSSINQQENSTINITYHNYKIIMQCLNTLIELIQGPCKPNQIQLLDNSKFLETITIILQQQVTKQKINARLSNFAQDTLYDIDNLSNTLDGPQFNREATLVKPQEQTPFSFLQKEKAKQIQLTNQKLNIMLCLQQKIVSQVCAISENFSSIVNEKFKNRIYNSEWMYIQLKHISLIGIHSLLEGNSDKQFLFKINNHIKLDVLNRNLEYIYFKYTQLYEKRSFIYPLLNLDMENFKVKRIYCIRSCCKCCRSNIYAIKRANLLICKLLVACINGTTLFLKYLSFQIYNFFKKMRFILEYNEIKNFKYVSDLFTNQGEDDEFQVLERQLSAIMVNKQNLQQQLLEKVREKSKLNSQPDEINSTTLNLDDDDILRLYYDKIVEEESLAKVEQNLSLQQLQIYIGFNIYSLIDQFLENGKQAKDYIDDPDIQQELQLNQTKNFNFGSKILYFIRIMRKILLECQICRKLDQKVNDGAPQIKQLSKAFFKKHTAKIEISQNNQPSIYYFPKLPQCERLSSTDRQKFEDRIDRTSTQTKISYIQNQAYKVMVKLDNEQDFQEGKRVLTKQLNWIFFTRLKAYQKVTFWVGLFVNGLMLVLLEDYHFFKLDKNIMSIDDQQEGSFQQEFSLGILQFKEEDLQTILTRLIILQIILTIIMGSCYMFKRYFFAKLLVDYQTGKQKMKCHLQQKSFICKTVIWLMNNLVYQCSCRSSKQYCTDFCAIYEKQLTWLYFFYRQKGIFLYYMAYIWLAILGYLNPIFSSLLLIDIFRQYPQLKKILQSIWIPKKQIFLTLVLFLILTYYFGLLYYFYYYHEIDPLCRSLSGCVTMMFDLTFKADGGFVGTFSNDYSQEWGFNAKVIYDFAYIFLVIVLIGELLAGTIIDQFGSLREKQEEKDQDRQNVCVICGQTRNFLDKEQDGFSNHITYTHCFWDYIFFIMYLSKKNTSDHTGIESYVWKTIQQQQTSWFPQIWEQKNEQQIQEDDKIDDSINHINSQQEKLIQTLNQLHIQQDQFMKVHRIVLNKPGSQNLQHLM